MERIAKFALAHVGEGYILKKGDCLEVMKAIPDGSVDMILCDLPYGVTDHNWDQIIDGRKLFDEYKRICKQNANVLLFCQIEFAKYLMLQTFPSEFSHCLVWVKDNKTRYMSVNSLPMSQYEMVLCFRLNKYANKSSHQDLRRYFTDELKKSGKTVEQIELEVPNRSAHHWFRFSSDYRIPTEKNYKRLQEITGCFERDYSEVKTEFVREKNNTCTYNGNNESDVLLFALTEKREHPTQKPVSLLEYLIRIYSNPGETVLDNCMGSGSTGVACANTGRQFIGIELDDKYFDIASKRIADAFSGDSKTDQTKAEMERGAQVE